MLLKSTLVAAAVLMGAGTAFAADCSLSGAAADGKTVSQQCKSCHVFEADKPSRPTGPNLHDVYESKAASRTDFSGYSDAMRTASGKGLTWTEANLFDYLGDPKAFLTKTIGTEAKHKMFFSVKDEDKRKAVIAYLKTIKGQACE